MAKIGNIMHLLSLGPNKVIKTCLKQKSLSQISL